MLTKHEEFDGDHSDHLSKQIKLKKYRSQNYLRKTNQVLLNHKSKDIFKN